MKKNIPTIILITSVILTSCVRSLYPITENENDLIFKKELLGHWRDEDSAHYIVDTAGGENGRIYRVAIIDLKRGPEWVFSDTSYFIAFLVNIKGSFFLDCSADMAKFSNKNIGESAAHSILPTHFIIRLISIEQNRIELALMDEEKFLAFLKQKKLSIHHELIDKDNLLLTEKPMKLQQKLIEMEKFPSIFNSETLTRSKN